MTGEYEYEANQVIRLLGDISGELSSAVRIRHMDHEEAQAFKRITQLLASIEKELEEINSHLGQIEDNTSRLK